MEDITQDILLNFSQYLNVKDVVTLTNTCKNLQRYSEKEILLTYIANSIGLPIITKEILTFELLAKYEKHLSASNYRKLLSTAVKYSDIALQKHLLNNVIDGVNTVVYTLSKLGRYEEAIESAKKLSLDSRRLVKRVETMKLFSNSLSEDIASMVVTNSNNPFCVMDGIIELIKRDRIKYVLDIAGGYAQAIYRALMKHSIKRKRSELFSYCFKKLRSKQEGVQDILLKCINKKCYELIFEIDPKLLPMSIIYKLSTLNDERVNSYLSELSYNKSCFLPYMDYNTFVEYHKNNIISLQYAFKSTVDKSKKIIYLSQFYKLSLFPLLSSLFKDEDVEVLNFFHGNGILSRNIVKNILNGFNFKGCSFAVIRWIKETFDLNILSHIAYILEEKIKEGRIDKIKEIIEFILKNDIPIQKEYYSHLVLSAKKYNKKVIFEILSAMIV